MRLPLYLFVSALMITFGLGTIIPLAPTIVAHHGGTAASIGLLFGAYSISRFFSTPFLGALCDRVGRKRVMMISLAGAAVGYGGFAAASSMAWLALSWAVVGLTDGLAAATYAACADRSDPETRSQTFARLGAASGLGFILGPLLAASTIGYGIALPFLCVALVYLAALVGAYFLMPETRLATTGREPLAWRQMNSFVVLGTQLRRPLIRRFLVGIFLFWIVVMTAATNLAALIEYRAGWTPSETAFLFSLRGGLDVVLALLVVPFVVGRLGEARTALIGGIATAAGCAAFVAFAASADPRLLFGGLALFSIGQPHLQTAMLGLASLHTSESDQGKVQGAILGGQASAEIVGPLSAGFLFDIVGPGAPYILCTFAASIAGWLGWSGRRAGKAEPLSA